MKYKTRLAFTIGIALVAITALGIYAFPRGAAATVAPLRSAKLKAEPSCTIGDAQAMFQVLPIPAYVMLSRGIERPKLVDTLSQCQYRVFLDGFTFTFSEEDVFLGGVSYLYDYKQLGVTRQEAISELETYQDRVWLAEVLPGGAIGPWVEQPLMRTAYKNIQTTDFGLIVYHQRGFITQLPPGEYLSFWVGSIPGFPDSTATVRLVITPAGIAQ